MRERDKLFKSYCQEKHPTIKLTKPNDTKEFETL